MRGNARDFIAANVLDGRAGTYWATDEGVTTGWVELNWDRPTRFDRVVLREHIALGQRVRGWVLEAAEGDNWRQLAAGSGIGPRIIVRFPPAQAVRLRLRITQAKFSPALSGFAVYCAPNPFTPCAGGT